MADATIFTIENGEFALKLVDTAAVGYLDTWQAPAGKTVDTVTMADYETSSAVFKCQVTSGALTASPDTTTIDIPATFCSAGKTVPQPGQTSFSLELSFLSDINVMAGLNRFLFENDTDEAFFYLGFDNSNPPRAIGRVRCIAGTIGGEARATLTVDVTLPCSRKPDVEFGDSASSIIIAGDGTVTTPTVGATSTPTSSPSEPQVVGVA